MNPRCNHVCKRICLQVEGLLVSPLLVGSGEANKTDTDVILDSDGKPFIPGSSLAGALRDYLRVVEGKEKTDQLFGSLDTERQSRVTVYDTELKNFRLTTRDGVKLDFFKTAEDQAKYDIQVVEAGAGYTMRLELVLRENDLNDSEGSLGEAGYIELLRQICGGLKNHEIRLGAKKNRGFGKLSVEYIRVRTFDLRDKNQCFEWLDWDWAQEDAFYKGEPFLIKDTPRRYHYLRVPLEVEQSIIIRKYAAINTDIDCQPDYEHLKSSGKPVIPGSSWMGAIRSRLRIILEQLGLLSPGDWDYLEPLFGTWVTGDGDADLQASLVGVEESVIEEGHGLPLTRNAIDRFTGGTVRGALYTSMPWVGGNTELVLWWPKNISDDLHKAICGMLLWVVSDIQNGLLAVGGETSIGRGVFRPKDGDDVLLNNEPVVDKAQYFQAAIEWVKQHREKGGAIDGAAASS